MAFSPDGSRLAAPDNAGHLTVWATEQGTVLTSNIIELNNVDALSFVGQGESLMIAAGHVVEVLTCLRRTRLSLNITPSNSRKCGLLTGLLVIPF